MSRESFSNYTNLGDSISDESERRRYLGETKLSFGVSYLDDALDGISRDDLILLGGRSGHGKSELAVQIAFSNVIAGKKVFYFGLEFSKQELERRVLFKALSSRFFSDTERSPGIPDFQSWMFGWQEDLFEKYYNEEVGKLTFFKSLLIRNREDAFTIEDFERNIISEKDCDLYVIDHLHYFDFGDKENENAGMKRLMQSLNTHVREYDRPILLVSHLRKGDRKGDQLVPGQEDFHGSSDIFKIATRAITIAPAHNIKFDSKSKWATYVWCVKNRLAQDRARYVGLTCFDARKNQYDKNYRLQTINYGGTKIEDIQDWSQRPLWATNHKGDVI